MQHSEFLPKGCNNSVVCFLCDNATIVLAVKHQSLLPTERFLLLKFNLTHHNQPPCSQCVLAGVVTVSVYSAKGCYPVRSPLHITAL